MEDGDADAKAGGQAGFPRMRGYLVESMPPPPGYLSVHVFNKTYSELLFGTKGLLHLIPRNKTEKAKRGAQCCGDFPVSPVLRRQK